MPANPTAQGWTESQIRLYQYKGFEILFDYLLHFYDYIDQEKYRAIHAEEHLNDRIDSLEVRFANLRKSLLNSINLGEGLVKDENTLRLDFGVIQPKIKTGKTDPVDEPKVEGDIYINLTSGSLFRADETLTWIRIGDISRGTRVYFSEDESSNQFFIRFKEER